MKRFVVAFACGALFALGLTISGMTHPSKVLAFLDFAGAWDPSLALVMASGVLVNVLFFRVALRRGAPLLGGTFALPSRQSIDARLVGGAAVFGVGWGLGGFCPGPAVVSVAGGAAPVIVFVVAMVVGMALHDGVAGHRSDS
ncbi:MAG TPA: DUF6691 family protein [Polyangiaceae bacterium]|nr:DUF6691 family protein [Polyangiaceae bacterium]